jgi:hypothetical protein
VTNPLSLPSFYCTYDTLPPFTPRNTSSFLTRSVKLIFSILPPPPHYISELSRYLRSTLQSIPVSSSYNAMLPEYLSAPLKMGPIGSPETSVLNQTTLRNIPEKDGIQANRSESLRFLQNSKSGFHFEQNSFVSL